MAENQRGLDYTFILVGCGGSGLNTLSRLNAMLAEDSYWSQRIARDIYYVAVDTDVAAMKKFENSTADQLRGHAQLPVVKKILLSQNLEILQPTVDRYFVTPFAGGDSRGRDRLLEHWWHRHNEPFRAPQVKPVFQGAGQCPPVSYFLAWKSLRLIEKALSDLIGEIQNRKAGRGGEPLEYLNFSLVGSTAGGTGRGCWALVAFKIRQLLEKYGKHPEPVAYLFDAHTFPDVFKQEPDQKVSMLLNSLTGFSELDAWTKNRLASDEQSKAFSYRLPSMEAPADTDMDVLQTQLHLDCSSGAPVDNAYLIFDKNETIHLEHSEQFQEMVGTALYAAITQSSRNRTKINTSVPFRGLMAATFEVNAQNLRTYYEGFARMEAVDQLKRFSEEDQAAVNAAKDEFFKQHRLQLSGKSDFRPNERGTFPQVVCARLLAECNNDLAALDEALRSDNVDDVQQAINAAVVKRETVVEKLVRGAAAELSPVKAVRDTALKLSSGRSVQSALNFVESIKATLLHLLKVLPAESQMKLDDRDKPQPIAASVSGREYKLFGRHFNEQESIRIKEVTQEAIIAENYPSLQRELERVYKQWIAELDLLSANAGRLLDCAGRVRVEFEQEQKKACGRDYAGDLFDAFFTDRDDPAKSLPLPDSPRRFYRREIKPVFNRGQEKQILQGQIDFGAELPKLVEQCLTQAPEASLSDYDRDEHLCRDLGKAIRGGVHIRDYALFVKRNFSIEAIIKDLRTAWREALRRTANNYTALGELADQFEQFFGVPINRDDPKFPLPEGNDFICQMGSSLAATCKPLWLARKRTPQDGEPDHRVTLFLPVSRNDKDSVTRKVQSAVGAGVSVAVECADGEANPFMILAYSTAGVDRLEDIASLDYWRDDARVRKWLDKCEDKQGDSIFTHAENNKGVGYVSPLYVNHEIFSSLRWHPWLDAHRATTTDITETLDALIYATMELSGRAADTMTRIGWQHPLVKNQGKQIYQFMRPAYRLSDGTPMEDPACPWTRAQRLAQSIRNAYDILGGNGGGDWRRRILAEARDFWLLADQNGFGRETKDGKELLKAELERLGRCREGSHDDDDGKIWLEMVKRQDNAMQKG